MTVNVTILQRAVSDVEDSNNPRTFDDLCDLMAKSDYCKRRNMDAKTVAELIIANKVKTAVAQPPKKKRSSNKADSTPPVKQETTPPVKQETKPPVSEPTKIVKTFDEPGRGRKQCPSCKKYVGVQTGTCVCGHKFIKKPAQSKVAPVVKPAQSAPQVAPVPKAVETNRSTSNPYGIVRYPGRIPRIHTAAGKAYHTLKGTSFDEVREWVNKCRTTGIQEHGIFLKPDALIYWVDQFYRWINVKERVKFDEAKKHILTMCENEGIDLEYVP